jgi:hypothetical protein
MSVSSTCNNDIDDEDSRNGTGGNVSDEVEDEFERRYNDRFKSIRSRTGLEVGIAVSWPGIHKLENATGKEPSDPRLRCAEGCWELSTCLSSDCIAPLFHGTQWAGTRVWRAAVVAIEYLLSEEAELRIGPDHVVIELGCGLGVPGMVLHALRRCTVLLTDMGDLVPTLRGNLSKAFPKTDSSAEPTITPNSIAARELDWSARGLNKLAQETGLNTIDVALSCDCIFEPLYGDSWEHLLECQVALLRSNPIAFVLTIVERRKFDGIEQYLQALARSGVAVRILRPKSFTYPPLVELYRLFIFNPP